MPAENWKVDLWSAIHRYVEAHTSGRKNIVRGEKAVVEVEAVVEALVAHRLEGVEAELTRLSAAAEFACTNPREDCECPGCLMAMRYGGDVDRYLAERSADDTYRITDKGRELLRQKTSRGCTVASCLAKDLCVGDVVQYKRQWLAIRGERGRDVTGKLVFKCEIEDTHEWVFIYIKPGDKVTVRSQNG